MRLYERADCESDLTWHFVAGTTRPQLFANCNDTFYWACSDCEEITPANLAILENAYRDLANADVPVPGRAPVVYFPELFAARVRGTRPQRARLAEIDTPEVVALFEACGPVRDPKDEG